MLGRYVEGLTLRCAVPIGKLATARKPEFRQPVFVVGTGRCGTTLLMRILSAHPAIAIFPGEANALWHPGLYPIDKAKVAVPPIEIDPEAFTRCSLANWPPDHPERIRRTFYGFNVMAGKSRTLVVKSAMISHMLPALREVFPQAKFVHLYRYAPSVIESYFQKNFNRYADYRCTRDEYYKACARYWNSCILQIEHDRVALRLNEQGAFHELSYEDLCADPEGILKGLFAFLEVDHERSTFDLSSIKSTNIKVEDSYQNGDLKSLIDPEIGPAMKLKGYPL
ncbi:MAG: sulfotransferase [Thermoleophilia bacterium]|nr:sulfotransferase [Thermoleophilia bacterium]